MLKQQWRSKADATLQHCAERRIGLMKENSQVKKNIFQRKLLKLGVDTSQKNLQTILQSRKIIFQEKKAKTGSRYIAEKSADISRSRNNGKFKKKNPKERKNQRKKLPKAT
jgi:hypothetical protein